MSLGANNRLLGLDIYGFEKRVSNLLSFDALTVEPVDEAW